MKIRVGRTRQSSDATLRHEIAFHTDIGHTHAVNQDAGGAWTAVRGDGAPASLLVVADGVSSGKRSEDASRLVVDVIAGRLVPLLGDVGSNLDSLLYELGEATRLANHDVAVRPHESEYSADATTVTALVCVGSDAAGLWCGDSRVYRLAGEVERLTRDHSWAEAAVESGLMTPEQAAQDPRAHAITRWIGPPDQEDPGIEVFRSTLEPGGCLLCCSDGLYKYFEPPLGKPTEMQRPLEEMALDSAIKALVQTALRRGGVDNISAAALRLVEGSTI